MNNKNNPITPEELEKLVLEARGPSQQTEACHQSRYCDRCLITYAELDALAAALRQAWQDRRAFEDLRKADVPNLLRQSGDLAALREEMKMRTAERDAFRQDRDREKARADAAEAKLALLQRKYNGTMAIMQEGQRRRDDALISAEMQLDQQAKRIAELEEAMHGLALDVDAATGTADDAIPRGTVDVIRAALEKEKLEDQAAELENMQELGHIFGEE